MTHPRPNPGSLQELPGVGPQMAARLALLGIRSQRDLLFYLPSRYQDRTRLMPVAELPLGQELSVSGQIRSEAVYRYPRPTLVVLLEDPTGLLTLRFFQGHKYLRDQLRPGRALLCFGSVRRGPYGLEMVHPEFEVADDGPPAPPARLTPIYPITEGVTQGRLRAWIVRALDHLAPALDDFLAASVRDPYGWPPLVEALETVHRPPPALDVQELNRFATPAQRRLAFEELLAHHLARRRIAHHRYLVSAPKLEGAERLPKALIELLSFDLTSAQQRAWAVIRGDLATAQPMQRLLQGDVGSGKTMVAALALLQAVESGYQAAFMAPTELLAEQHYTTLRGWLESLDVPIYWLAGGLGAGQRRAVLSALGEGQPAVAVGTHALFQREVEFAHLGLVVIDEQHRFGVHQRMALKAKGDNPHLLIMTATPIPRTLTMTAFADLTVTLLDELPSGRHPVETVAVSTTRRSEVEARVRSACAQGQKAYWVCPLVEKSDQLQLETVTATFERLQQTFPKLQLGLLHGKMGPEEKDEVMAAFQAGTIQLLVATPVIEVGIDVPDATLMVIEHAERMGLAQLHQLRGRVGRGRLASVCVLLYQPPLTAKARERLATLRKTQDGFQIAESDLALRGPGEVLGTRQSGLERMRIADLDRDQGLIPDLRPVADALMRQEPDHVTGLIQRWLGERADYGEIG